MTQIKGVTMAVNGEVAYLRITEPIEQWDRIAQRFSTLIDDIIASGAKTLMGYINCPGGSLFDGNEIANQIRRFKGRKIAKLGALCASAATVVANAFDHIDASRNTSYMIHGVAGGIYGKIPAFEDYLQLMRNLEETVIEEYQEKTGLPVSEIKQMLSKDSWMTAKEAKEKKFIDSIDKYDGENADEIDNNALAYLKSQGFTLPSNLAEIPIQQTNTDENIMKDLIPMLSLDVPANADNATITAAVTAKMKALEAENNKLKEDAEKAEKATREAAIKQAIGDRKITADEAKEFDDMPTAYVLKSLALMKPVGKLSEMTTGGKGSPSNREGWDWDKWMKEDPEALERMEEEEPERFKAIYDKFVND